MRKVIIILLCVCNFLTSQTTLLNEDFTSNSVGYITTDTSSSNYQIINDCNNESWEVVSYHQEKCNSCDGKFIAIQHYNDDCVQDNVFVSKSFSPTQTTITISFDYSFNYYISGANYFEVYLYNETDELQVGSDLIYHTSDKDTSYSSDINISGTNSIKDNYSLRFHYYGENDWGATFDNILITEPTDSSGNGGETREIHVGTSTTTITPLVPSYALFEYGWSGMIYLQDEIRNEGSIEKISFPVSGDSPESYLMDSQKIYMAHTTYDQFPSSVVEENFEDNYVNTDWTLVYEGSIDWSPGWEEIILSTKFNYNNVDNLLIKFENRDGEYSFDYPYFFYTLSTNKSSFGYKDREYPLTAGTRSDTRANILFTINTGSPLHIDLTSFEGVLDGTEVELEWEVASQTNNDYFIVDHSLDGENWDKINEVIGDGTTTNKEIYNLKHINPSMGENYYRLTHVDFDGRTEVYDPIIVDVCVCMGAKEIIRLYNIQGQVVNKNYHGIVIQLWDNGQVTKAYNR